MKDFTTILYNTVVASSAHGVSVTDKFQHINGTELLAKLRKIAFGVKDGSHFLRTNLNINDSGACQPRADSNTTSMASVIILDCDKRIDANGEILEGAPDPYKINLILRENRIAHILYGSYSHYVGNKGNRYRILIPTNNPYTKEQLPPTVKAIIYLINANLDSELLADANENNTWSQPWYYPRKPLNSTVDDLYIEYLEGKTVEVIEPANLPSETHTSKKATFFKAGEISPINAFNEQHKLGDLLIHYGYKKIYYSNDHEKWLSPDSTSGNAGITVQDNKFFSHHGNCPFNDEYWHDAFDLMRIKEGLTESEAVIKAAQNTVAPDGRTVDEHNKSLASKKPSPETQTPTLIKFEQYKPFNNDLLPVESIPYEALPETMAEFIKEHSIIRGCPPDYILVSTLARLGCVFSGKIKIALTRNTNWYASPNFFWMMAGNPSSGKSNAFSLTNKPIQDLEEQARKKHKETFRLYKDALDILERKLSAVQKGMDRECAKKSTDHEAIRKFEELIKNLKQQIHQLEEQKPKLKRYTIQKLTIEKLILILEENPEGTMLEVDELSSVFIRLSKDENGDERALYLSGYNGNIPYSYDTIKRGTVLIPNLLLSILGGTQPSKLKRFLNEAKNGHQDDGLLQRFQGVVYPDRNLMLPVDRKGNDLLANTLTQVFQNLDNLPLDSTDSGITILRFHDDAQTIFDEWREETATQAHGLSYPLDAHVGKAYEFIAALSAYLYLYENNGKLTDDKLISSKHILSAIKLGKYFLSHAKRMYGLAYQNDMPARSLSEKLAKLVASQNKDGINDKLKHHSFTRSQIRAKGWADLNTKEQRQEAIETLINRGHISKQLNGRYYINPEHLKD